MALSSIASIRLLSTTNQWLGPWRSGRELDLPTHELVSGDMMLVRAGDGIPADCRLLGECNLVVLGTYVVSGSGLAVVVRIGRATEFGRISKRLRLRPPQTEFEHGMRRFGAMLLEIT